MGKAALVRTNLAELGIAKIGATSTSGSMSANNLLTPEPSEKWRSGSVAPWDTRLVFEWQTPSGPSLNALALVGHNMRLGSGQYRFATFSTDNGHTWQHIPPASSASAVNATGTYSDVDEDPEGAPDGNWITPTTPGSTWGIRFTFGSPTYSLVAGAGKQAFAVWAKASTAPSANWEAPHLTAQLYKSAGVFVKDLGGKYVTSATGQWLIWTWDADADLNDLTGATTELRLIATTGASTRDVHVGVVDWWAETVGDGTAVVLSDSGWIDAIADLGVSEFGSMRPIESEPSATALCLLDAAVSPTTVRLYLRDDGAPAGLFLNERQIETPDTYLEAGVLVLGTAWRPTYNFAWGDCIGPIIDLSEKSYSDGGQTWGQKKARLRTLLLPLENLTQSETHALLDLVWRKGRLSPVLVSLFPDSAIEAKHSTLWATVDEVSATSARSAFINGQSLRGMSIKFVEYH